MEKIKTILVTVTCTVVILVTLLFAGSVLGIINGLVADNTRQGLANTKSDQRITTLKERIRKVENRIGSAPGAEKP